MLNEIYLVQIQSQIINIEEEPKYIYSNNNNNNNLQPKKGLIFKY